MKTRITSIIIVVLIICVWSYNVIAQTSVPNGKAQLTEFTNATAKFTVPAGKTWEILSVLTSTDEGDKQMQVLIKTINGNTLTDLSTKMYGPSLCGSHNYSSVAVPVQYPIVLPENTTFELVIITTGATPSLCYKKAFLNYIETSNL